MWRETHLLDADPATRLQEVLHVPSALCRRKFGLEMQSIIQRFPVNLSRIMWSKFLHSATRRPMSETTTVIRYSFERDFKVRTTAGEGTWMLETDLGRMWLARWQSTTPSLSAAGRSSGSFTFRRDSTLCKKKNPTMVHNAECCGLGKALFRWRQQVSTCANRMNLI